MSDSSTGGRGDRRNGLTIQKLVTEHHQLLYRYAFRMIGNESDAEDLTQQTYLIAQNKLDQLRQPAAARAWLCRILRTTFLKSCRKRRPWSAVDLDMDMNAVVGQWPNTSPLDQERLKLALDELPEMFKLVLLMFYFEDRTYQEIADELEVPLGTIMSRLSRAKAHLRKRLDPVETTQA